MKKDFHKSGTYIKTLRLKRGMTQKQFSDAIGIGTQFLSNIERGLCFVPARACKDIKKNLNMTNDELTKLAKKFVSDSNKNIKIKTNEMFN